MPNGSYLLAARCITYNVLLFCNKHCKKFLSFSREKSSKVRNNLSICRVALQNRCTRKQTYSPLKAEARQVVSRVRSWVAKSLRLPNLSTKQAYIYFQPRSTTVSCLLGECQTLYQTKEMSRKIQSFTDLFDDKRHRKVLHCFQFQELGNAIVNFSRVSVTHIFPNAMQHSTR